VRAPSASPHGAPGASANVVKFFSAALPFALATATAVLQLAIASRWDGRTAHVTSLAAGWAGALWLTWIDRRLRSRGESSRLERALGLAFVAVTWFVVIAGRAEYNLVNRFLPVLAGVGLVVLSSGLRSVLDHRRELLLLSLTLLYPLPFAIQQLLMPTSATAATAAVLVQAAGIHAQREGTLLVFPDTTLRVFDACSGITLMTQTTLLAVLVLCFFPATLRRAIAVLVVALASGFLVNAVRIAMLGVVAARNPSQFDYWEQYVAGSVLFPVIATAFAGTLWWLLLRCRAERSTGPAATQIKAATQA
jgi:cyanoexosortase A